MSERRVIIPRGSQHLVSRNDVIITPGVNNVLSDALNVISTEVARFSGKVRNGKPLEEREARTLQGYVRALVELSREERERAKTEDLSRLTTEELAALVGISETEKKT